MQIALELSSELKKIAELEVINPTFKTIMTTNFKDGSDPEEIELKKLFMGN